MVNIGSIRSLPIEVYWMPLAILQLLLLPAFILPHRRLRLRFLPTLHHRILRLVA